MIQVRPNPRGSVGAAGGSGGSDPPRKGDNNPLPIRDFIANFDEYDSDDDQVPAEDELAEYIYNRDVYFKTFNTQKRKLRHFRDGLM